jgi:hypothetical protein
MLLIIGDQRLGIAGRGEFFLEPARIEQKRVEPASPLKLRSLPIAATTGQNSQGFRR